MHIQYLEAVVQRCSVKKVFSKISRKFAGKHLCQSLFFNKVAGPRGFPVNFVKFQRTPFYIEHLWWLLLTSVFPEYLFPGNSI